MRRKEKGKLLKYAIEGWFPDETGHNVLQGKQEWASGFLNEFVPSFNNECLLCARNCSELGDTATHNQAYKPLPAWILNCGILGVAFCVKMFGYFMPTWKSQDTL